VVFSLWFKRFCQSTIATHEKGLAVVSTFFFAGFVARVLVPSVETVPTGQNWREIATYYHPLPPCRQCLPILNRNL
jgi:hypothetical protein